jgi:hypothetical protein
MVLQDPVELAELVVSTELQVHQEQVEPREHLVHLEQVEQVEQVELQVHPELTALRELEVHLDTTEVFMTPQYRLMWVLPGEFLID